MTYITGVKNTINPY